MPSKVQKQLREDAARKCRQEGRGAFTAGKTRESNPYGRSPSQFYWYVGYDAEEQDSVEEHHARPND